MRINFKQSLAISVILPMLSFSLGAQGLPALPEASEVVTGTLPNGISYYLVTNPEVKGSADFALIQKGTPSEEASRAALAALPHFQSLSPYQYLAKLGVGYKKYGFIESDGQSASYRFEGVPVSQQAARDTALLMLFDISETYPFEQAIVVSGDIDKGAVQERMGVFSMMVTPRAKLPEHDAYEWTPSNSLEYDFVKTPPQKEAVVRLSYSSARTPRGAMNTLQPLMTELFAREFGIIASRRFERECRKAGIPLASVTPTYVGSARTPGAESCGLTFVTAAAEPLSAMERLAAILLDMDAHGVTAQELQLARDRILSEQAGAAVTLSNREWVDKCAAAFLYGADLASPQTVKDFFSSRNIASQRELELFNEFVSALLNGEKGLSICYEGPDDCLSRDGLISLFAPGDAGDVPDTSIAVNFSDTLGLYAPSVRAKLKRAVPEPVTGGELWTFSNGMKVIFKRTDVRKGSFSYGLMLNGGYTAVEGLARGEGGFVGDMLGICDVAGLSGHSFADLLAARNIGFDASVSLTDLRITGTASSSDFHLLMKSLLTVANDRRVNAYEYDYYRKSELLRRSVASKSQEGVNTAVDSIMCPQYVYSPAKIAEGLSDDLPSRAEAYFARQFAKCDDGVLVIVGDLDPFMLKKALPKLIGGFPTGGQPSVRPQIDYTLRSGWSTYTVEADSDGVGEPGLDVAQSALIPISSGSFMTFLVTVMELEKKLSSALAGTGMYAEVTPEYTLSPSERLTVRISCRPAESRGLPLGVEPEDPLRTLGVVRSSLAGFAGESPSGASVNASKAVLQTSIEAALKQPSFLVDAALMRYSVGKNLYSGYKNSLNAVTPESVREMAATMEDSCKVEFVIY